MQPFEFRIARHAPDSATLRTAFRWSNPLKWRNLGQNAGQIWGETAIPGLSVCQVTTPDSLHQGACNCRAEARPCEHILGLALLHARLPKHFPLLPTPEWVAEMPETATPPDKKEAARKQRAQERLLAVASGIDELERFLRDIIRQGLLNLGGKDQAYFDQIARRMVDAKAPGLAGRLRRLGAMNHADPEQTGPLAQLAKLWMLVEGFRKLDHLPEKMADDLRIAIGWTYKKEDIVQAPQPDIVSDRWLALQKKESREDDLDVTRTWLQGIDSGRFALIIDYVHPSAPYENPFRSGQIGHARLAFYPAAWPQRALLLEWVRNERAQTNFPSPLPHWPAAQAVWSAALANAPFLEDMPFLVAGLQLISERQQWRLRDAQGLALTVDPNWETMQYRQLLALSGAAPTDMYLLRSGMFVAPLGLILNQQYYPL